MLASSFYRVSVKFGGVCVRLRCLSCIAETCMAGRWLHAISIIASLAAGVLVASPGDERSAESLLFDFDALPEIFNSIFVCHHTPPIIHRRIDSSKWTIKTAPAQSLAVVVSHQHQQPMPTVANVFENLPLKQSTSTRTHTSFATTSAASSVDYV